MQRSKKQTSQARALTPTRERQRPRRKASTIQIERTKWSKKSAARTQSTDGASGPHGGQLEWFARRDLPAPFVAPLFEATAGSVVGPIAHAARWYVVRCDEGPMAPPVHMLEPLRAQATAWMVEQTR